MSSRVEISKRILAVNSVGTVVRAVLSTSVLLWMHQYLIRSIPDEEYVLLPVVTAVVAVMPLLSTVLAAGLSRFVTEAHARGDPRRVTEITSTMAPLMLLAALLLLAVGAVLAWRIDWLLEIAPSQVANARAMLVILVVAVASRVGTLPFLMGFVVRQRFVLRDTIGLGAELLRLGLLVYLLTQHEARALWVPVAALVSGLVELSISAAWSRRLLPEARFDRTAMRRDVVRPILGFGSWTILGQVSRIVREVADPIILNRFGTNADLVAFNLGAQIDRQFRRTLLGATIVAQPAATAMVATAQGERLRRTWLRLCRYSLWAMLAVAVPFIVFRTEFFELYLREKFAPNRDAPVVLGLLLGRYLAIFPNAAIGIVTVARGELRAASLQALGLELANLALTLVLVGGLQLGAVGAAAATFAVAVVGQPLLVWPLGLRLSGVGAGAWLRLAVLPGVAPALAMAPVWLLLRAFVEPHSWPSLLACGAAGGLGYALVLLLVTSPDDRRDLRTALGLSGVKKEQRRADARGALDDSD